MEYIQLKTWTGNGTLTLSEHSIHINYAGRDEVIPISQIVGFEVKDPKGKMRPGMVRIRLGGSSGAGIALTSFLATGMSNNIEFPHAYDYLNAARQMQSYIANYSVQQPQGASSADEIKKFKELLDMGVITQEEFDAKKHQLLGL